MSVERAIKIALGWIAILAGVSLSVFALGLLGVEPLVSPYGVPWRTWFSSVTLFSLGCTALTASLIAFRSRKISSLLYLIAAPLVSLSVWVSRYPLADVISDPRGQHPSASVALAFVPLLLLGYFWSIAHRYHWPGITTGTMRFVWAKLVPASVASLLFCACVCATSVHLASSWELPGDCGGPPAFSRPYPGHAVFVARVVHVDSITGAMAIVEQRFGGLPWWNKIVFLKFVQRKNIYFVDGRFEEGIVTRWFVPVLDLKCTASAPFQNAGVELRLFRGNPQWQGVRLIGQVLS